MAELTFYVEYEVKETFTETITIEYHDDDVDDVLERIKEDSFSVDGDIVFYFSNNFEPIVLEWRDCTLTKIEHVKDGENA